MQHHDSADTPAEVTFNNIQQTQTNSSVPVIFISLGFSDGFGLVGTGADFLHTQQRQCENSWGRSSCIQWVSPIKCLVLPNPSAKTGEVPPKHTHTHHLAVWNHIWSALQAFLVKSHVEPLKACRAHVCVCMCTSSNSELMKQMISLIANSLTSAETSNRCALCQLLLLSHPAEVSGLVVLKFCISHHWTGSSSGKNAPCYAVHLSISLINHTQAPSRFF